MHDSDRFDYDDDMQRPSKGKFPGWAIVVLCAVPVVGVLLIVAGFGLFAARRSVDAEAARVQADGAMAQQAKGGLRAFWTRDRFKAMMGATREDVAAEFGEPQVKFTANERTTWQYHNKSINPTTGEIDPVTLVVFVGGVVVEVNFQPLEENKNGPEGNLKRKGK